MVNVTYNKKKSINIREKLENYFKNLSDPICPFKGEDKYEHKLILPHIGDRYCLKINGKSRRILFVGLEGRYDDEYKTVNKRTCQIKKEGRNSRFYHPRGDDQWRRNKHMRGVTLATALLLGRNLSKEHTYDEELIDNRHLFDYIALSNWYLCGHFRNNEVIRPRKTHYDYAAVRQFYRIVKIIEPDIVLVTGKMIEFVYAFEKVFNGNYNWINSDDRGLIFTCENKELPFPIVRFIHPSKVGKTGWDLPDKPYYKKTVRQTVEKVVNIYL